MPSSALPAGLSPGGRFPTWTRPPVALVAADLDGTVLGSDGDVSPAVARAVSDAVAAGVGVGFATGRMRNGVIHIHRSVGAPGPHIFHNGAEVRAEGATIASWPLSAEATDWILQTAVELDIYGELYTEEGFWTTKDEPRAEVHWEMLNASPAGHVGSRDDLDGDVLKATFIAFDEQEAQQLLGAVSDRGLQVGRASAGDLDWAFVNVTMPGVHKGRAMEAAARHLGVDLSEVMALGDGDNDREMLEVAGTAVAMGQASDDLKELAHVVAPTVDADGAAVAISGLVVGAT